MKFGMSRISRLSKNRKALAGIVLAAVAIVAFFVVSISSGTTSIATFTVEKGEFLIDITEKGELQAARSTSVSVPRRVYGSTRIMSIVEDGTMVEEGDFLVQFDTSEFENRVRERTNELENARAELASQKASIESNRKQMENNLIIQEYSYEQAKLKAQQMKYEAAARQREMELEFKKAELSLQQAREKLESQKIIDEANLSKAELRVRQAEQRLQEAKDMLDALTLTAPKSGMAVLQQIWGPNGREKVKVGSTPHRGMELVSIPDLSVMQVKTQVNEIDVSRVSVGQQAVITLDALDGPTFYGTVTNVATLATSERGSDVKVFEVVVTIDGQDERLKPGMSAQCKIVTNKVDDVLYVPLEAVFDKEDTTVVFVKNGGFEKRMVEIGSKNSDYIIVHTGIEAGEEIALRDPTMPLEDLGLEEEGSGNGNGKGGSGLPL